MFKVNLNVSLFGYNRNPLNKLRKIIIVHGDNHIKKQNNTLRSKIQSASVIKMMVRIVAGDR
jgi:hypothetical protein